MMIIWLWNFGYFMQKMLNFTINGMKPFDWSIFDKQKLGCYVIFYIHDNLSLCIIKTGAYCMVSALFGSIDNNGTFFTFYVDLIWKSLRHPRELTGKDGTHFLVNDDWLPTFCCKWDQCWILIGGPCLAGKAAVVGV